MAIERRPNGVQTEGRGARLSHRQPSGGRKLNAAEIERRVVDRGARKRVAAEASAPMERGRPLRAAAYYIMLLYIIYGVCSVIVHALRMTEGAALRIGDGQPRIDILNGS